MNYGIESHNFRFWNPRTIEQTNIPKFSFPPFTFFLPPNSLKLPPRLFFPRISLCAFRKTFSSWHSSNCFRAHFVSEIVRTTTRDRLFSTLEWKKRKGKSKMLFLLLLLYYVTFCFFSNGAIIFRFSRSLAASEDDICFPFTHFYVPNVSLGG